MISQAAGSNACLQGWLRSRRAAESPMIQNSAKGIVNQPG
jgi:hypothetical protein